MADRSDRRGLVAGPVVLRSAGALTAAVAESSRLRFPVADPAEGQWHDLTWLSCRAEQGERRRHDRRLFIELPRAAGRMS